MESSRLRSPRSSGTSRPESVHSLATNILADYASDDPDLSPNLLMDADPKAYASFFPIAQRQETKTLALFQAEIARKPTPTGRPPLDPSWTKPDARLTGKIESAQGMLAERFAFCQTMPLDEFVKTAEALRKSGYRPIRFRPYAEGRDPGGGGLDPRWATLANGSRSDRRRDSPDRRTNTQGGISFLSMSPGIWLTGARRASPPTAIAALWAQETGPDDEPEWYVAYPPEDEAPGSTQDAGLVPLTLHAWRQAHDKMSYCGVWQRRQGSSDTLHLTVSRKRTSPA